MPRMIDYDRAFFASNTSEKLLELVQEMNTIESHKANKALNYYDGLQKEELIKVLDETRKAWRSDSVIPRTRNLTKMIVEKSGQIIHDTPPVYSVFDRAEDDNPNEEATERLIELLNKADSIETWINLDEVVRLLKTALLLVAWNEEAQCIVYDILHRGNSVIKWEPVSKLPVLLLYRLWSSDGKDAYRLYLEDSIIDFVHEPVLQGSGTVSIKNDEDNPYGIVPVAQFYDTQAPRTGFWNVVPHDIVDMNEIYNISITESEYAMSWMKKPTLFTNTQLADSHVEETASYGRDVETTTQLGVTSKFPHQRLDSQTDKVKFGPSTAIQLDSTGVDSPFAEFKAPDVDLAPLSEVVDHWVKSFASDWSVRIDVGGEGRASSGFQLIVEELPNMELRRQRQKMFAVGLTRTFGVVKIVANTHSDANFTEESKLFVTFTEPSLPVDTKIEEELWSHKIEKGRASVVDYFVEVKGMSPEEAVEKIAEIEEINSVLRDARTPDQLKPENQTEDEEQEQEEEES